MKHSLSEIHEDTRTAVCDVCGPTSITLRDGRVDKLNSKYRCSFLAAKNKRHSLRPHTRYRKESCETCGFIPQHGSQLDVDHIDGNSKNNDPSNLQTLCANCHRLKTILNADWQRNPVL